MELIEFIGKYPSILNHPNLHTDLYSVIFRHELCHLLEREMDKAFLPNFGFEENFGEDLFYNNYKYFLNFIKREIRVMTLETISPFYQEEKQYVRFSDSILFRIKENNLEYFCENYKKEQEKFYNRKIWWQLFEEKYEVLKTFNKKECFV